MPEKELYFIGEVSKKLNISISTLRYYDKEGLLPLIKRDKNGNRLFDERDLEILSYITCFKNAGMTLKQIKSYFLLYEKGDATKEARYVLLNKQLEKLDEQLMILEQAKQVLLKKIEEL